MKFSWKMRERLVAVFLIGGVLPLIIAMGYVGYHAKVIIEEQSKDYLKASVNGFAQVTQVRYGAISGNIDIVLDQLNFKLVISAALNETLRIQRNRLRMYFVGILKFSFPLEIRSGGLQCTNFLEGSIVSVKQV